MQYPMAPGVAATYSNIAASEPNSFRMVSLSGEDRFAPAGAKFIGIFADVMVEKNLVHGAALQNDGDGPVAIAEVGSCAGVDISQFGGTDLRGGDGLVGYYQYVLGHAEGREEGQSQNQKASVSLNDCSDFSHG